jgi:hypothetical protein
MRTQLQRAATLLGLLIALPAAQAGSVTAGSADLTLSGGITGGYFRTTNIGQRDVDDYEVPDFLVELSTASDSAVGVTAAFGYLAMPYVGDGGVPANDPSTMNVQYGYVTVTAGAGVTVDAGILATMIGYEVAPTYANANVLLGAVWYEQPVYYKGVRATWTGKGFNVFAEANDDATLGGITDPTDPNYCPTCQGKSAVFGVNGSAGGFNYVVNFGNGFNNKDIMDFILSGKLGGIDTAVNLDYQKWDNIPTTPPNADDSAFGLALYATFPASSMVTVPVRVEFVSDGTSGLYGGVDSAYTLTVTPTYHSTENTFVRGEVAYIAASNDVFTDNSGAPQGTNASFNLQAGVTF